MPVIRTAHMENRDIMRMMVYGNVAFCDYRSVLKRDDNRGVLLTFLKDLFQLVFLLKVNKTLDRKEASQIVFEAFELWLGTNPALDYTRTPPRRRSRSRPASASSTRHPASGSTSSSSRRATGGC